MQGILETTENLAKIALNFAFIGAGKVDYIKFGNCWAIPADGWAISVNF